MQLDKLTTSVEIKNEPLSIKQSGVSVSDWVASIALIFTILSTIITLLWQRHLRKEDKAEQLAIRVRDAEESKNTRQKDDIVRKWNALYPHRLKFYTEFYDVLFQFVNYKGSSKDILTNSGTETFVDIRVRYLDIAHFCSLFNKFDEESKILFDKDIKQSVHIIYQIVKGFMDKPLPDRDEDLASLAVVIESVQSGYNKPISKALKMIQERVFDVKLNDELRINFQKQLDFDYFVKSQN
ncbi:MAG: hypothetical protein JW974_02975 [Alphaproteobacteria bacterium]|nr:hypothetical protein [Alphaproteobacteria bacterium]